jgi:ligand-binding sensor domain-containing protein
MKTPVHILLVFLSNLTCILSLPAQDAAFRLEELNISTAATLATVDCLFEDSRGFLWIGTYSGLYRYDGYSLLHFKNDPTDSLSISDNKIKKIVEDPSGNFWVGTQVGLNYFDMRTRMFKSYTDTLGNGLGKVEILDLKFDTSGVLWVGAADGLYHFNALNKSFIRDFPKENIEAVKSIEPVEHGIYICTNTLLYYVEKETHRHRIIPLPGVATKELSFLKKTSMVFYG